MDILESGVVELLVTLHATLFLDIRSRGYLYHPQTVGENRLK